MLESNHNGLEKVKERIIQHLSVMKLKKEKQGSILLLIGPPDTGKTSLGRSISDALGRKYVRVSLGGIKDEAVIRGHRRTYIGDLPGRIIQGMKKTGTKNPVFVLDEIDKLSVSYGARQVSFLKSLIPNRTTHSQPIIWKSHMICLVCCSSPLPIPPVKYPSPLLDRMEMIEISGYTKKEKLAIAIDHLLPYILEEHGLDADKLRIEDDALKVIIEKYTREAGVRGLKKQFARIARFVSEKIVSGSADIPYVVKKNMLTEILGKELIRQGEVRKENVPGVVTGLAWTPVGEDILFIEGTFMPGSGKLTLTGQLEDVMNIESEFDFLHHFFQRLCILQLSLENDFKLPIKPNRDRTFYSPFLLCLHQILLYP